MNHSPNAPKKVHWTKAQEAAIEAKDKLILVSAAAGSGKTAVLTERVIRRILDNDAGLSLTDLLIVTFTRAAAASYDAAYSPPAASASISDDTPSVSVSRAAKMSVNIFTSAPPKAVTKSSNSAFVRVNVCGSKTAMSRPP